MKQKVNPLVAIVIVLAAAAGAGWLIYANTQARMVDLPYKSDAQRTAEARQAAKGMMAGFSAMAKSQKAKPTGQAKGEPKHDSQSGQSSKPEQKPIQEN